MNNHLRRTLLTTLIFLTGISCSTLWAQHGNDTHPTEPTHETPHEEGCAGLEHEHPYDPVESVMHHIANSNEINLYGDVWMPLPCILYAPEHGWQFFMSSQFEHGAKSYQGYVLEHGVVMRGGNDFPTVQVNVDGFFHKKVMGDDGKEKNQNFVCVGGKEFKVYPASTLDGGALGGGITNFYDFSISKNVFGMLLVSFILCFIFLTVARAYKKRDGQAPKGLQSFMEPIFVFIRDEVAKPMIGHKYERYMPLIMTIFFFVLVCNLLGLVPFFPGSTNITGNLAVTMTLAVIVFIVTNINGNRHYWEHIFWMPGIPAAVKIILTPVEILSIFIKPFSLMIRLFANIAAGHIIILSLVGLIFVFGNAGESAVGAAGGMVVAIPFTLFMNVIELIVAFLQAFIFAMLTASYIGAAIEEPHHH